MDVTRRKILKINNLILRPSGAWSKQVHKFLHFMRQKGFDKAPISMGFTDEGQEILTYMPGYTIDYSLHQHGHFIELVKSSARLLKEYHDVSRQFITTQTFNNDLWYLTPKYPAEVICHGDYAPYNVVIEKDKVIGIFDFDTCHPGPIKRDIAYAIYRWALMSHPSNVDSFGNIEDQAHRARIFCEEYGVPEPERFDLVDTIIDRLNELVRFMYVKAQDGDQTFIDNISSGHDELYLTDINYLQENKKLITAILTTV